MMREMPRLIILIDTALPDGLDVVTRLRDFGPEVRIVALALAETEANVIAWAEAGFPDTSRAARHWRTSSGISKASYAANRLVRRGLPPVSCAAFPVLRARPVDQRLQQSPPGSLLGKSRSFVSSVPG
jgi:hypothetical protein